MTRSATKRLREQLEREEAEAAAARARDLGESDEFVAELQHRERSRLGWGPKAHEHFAENYVSSPEKLMRRARAKKAAAAKTDSTKTTTTTMTLSVSGSKGSNGNPPNAEESLTSAPALKKRKAEEEQKPKAVTAVSVDDAGAAVVKRPGWGPEAYKNFAENFVNSPDRYARELRMRKKLEAERLKKVPTVISDEEEGVSSHTSTTTTTSRTRTTTAAPVSRRLSYDDEDEDEALPTRTTVGHVVYEQPLPSSSSAALLLQGYPQLGGVVKPVAGLEVGATPLSFHPGMIAR